MNVRTVQISEKDFIAGLKAISGAFDDSFVEIRRNKERMYIEFSQMYRHGDTVKIGVYIVTALGISADDLSSSQWALAGCETCDYGSEYTTKINIPAVEFLGS